MYIRQVLVFSLVATVLSCSNPDNIFVSPEVAHSIIKDFQTELESSSYDLSLGNIIENGINYSSVIVSFREIKSELTTMDTSIIDKSKEIAQKIKNQIKDDIVLHFYVIKLNFDKGVLAHKFTHPEGSISLYMPDLLEYKFSTYELK